MIPAIVLSGGAEINSIALVEEFLQSGIPVVLVSLHRGSLLEGIPGIVGYRVLQWPPSNLERAVEDLLRIVRELKNGDARKWPVFATEDGGLRLLMEGRERLAEEVVFSRAFRLRMGGLDKAELFEHFESAGQSRVIAPTRVATAPDQVRALVEELGNDCVVKPALKAFSMDDRGMSSKVVRWTPGCDSDALEEELRAYWGLSEKWLVQKYLHRSEGAEKAFWAVVDEHHALCAGFPVAVRWKQPRMGGTGCWVCMEEDIEHLQSIAEDVVRSLEYVGLLEIEFLPDEEGNWRVLEINARPWLQVGMGFRAGVPMAATAYRVLVNEEVPPLGEKSMKCWVNPERLLLSALSGDYGNPFHALLKVASVIRSADVISVYDSALPHVRRKWLAGMVRKGFRQMGIRGITHENR